MSCNECIKGFVLAGTPTGSIVDFHGTKAYFAPGPAGNNQRAIVLLTDIFGIHLTNPQLAADNFAKRLRCDVWAPDMFNGEQAMRVEDMEPLLPDHAGVKVTFWNKLLLLWKILPRIGVLIRNRPSVLDPRMISFIKGLREDKGYSKISAIGYCFGGAVAVRLGSADVLQSLVICHAGNISLDQIKAIKIPTAWACAEEDMGFSAELRSQAEAAFAARKGKKDFVDYEFIDYKGTVHGFAARPNLAIPEVKEAFEAAFEQSVKWFDITAPVEDVAA